MSDYGPRWSFNQEARLGRGEQGALRMVAYALLDVADAIRDLTPTPPDSPPVVAGDDERTNA